MFLVLMNNFPSADVVETHADISTIDAAKKVLSQWTQKGDRIDTLEGASTGKGKRITPLIIVTPDGEPVDIFGQLILPE